MHKIAFYLQIGLWILTTNLQHLLLLFYQIHGPIANSLKENQIFTRKIKNAPSTN